MYKKFLQTIITNSFYLFLSVPSIVIAMEFNEEDPPEKPHLTSKQLREKVKSVQPTWWDSVEILTPTEQWTKWINMDLNKRGDPPYKKWENPFKLVTVYCCFSAMRDNNNLVLLQESYWKKSLVMTLKDAYEIMQRENEEWNIIYEKKIDEIRKEEEEYEEEKKFLNYKEATYKHHSFDYFTSPYREYPKDRVNPKIMEKLKEADREKRLREQQKREDEEKRKQAEENNKPEVKLAKAINEQTKEIQKQTEAIIDQGKKTRGEIRSKSYW